MRTITNEGDHPFRKDENYQKILDSSPDVIVLNLGSNDSKPSNWKGAENFKKELEDMSNELIKAVGSPEKLYVMTPNPYEPKENDKWA